MVDITKKLDEERTITIRATDRQVRISRSSLLIKYKDNTIFPFIADTIPKGKEAITLLVQMDDDEASQ